MKNIMSSRETALDGGNLELCFESRVESYRVESRAQLAAMMTDAAGDDERRRMPPDVTPCPFRDDEMMR
jgi:hypothetical protein